MNRGKVGNIMSKYTNIETIKAGNMQFNVKTAKNFRDTLAKWHDADFALAEKILIKSDRVKKLRGMIDTNNEDLARLEKGESGVIREKSVIEAENIDFEARIKAESDALAEYRKAQTDRYTGARELLNKDLHKAYEAYVTNGERDAYVVALANFFDENGLEPAMNSLNAFVAAVGKKKNSARQKVKTGNHNGAISYNAWRDIFLGEICDVMGDALPLYKFTYELKENRKNKKDA